MIWISLPLKAIEKPNLCPFFLFVTKMKTFEALQAMKRTRKTMETGISGRTDGGMPRPA